MNKRRPLTKSFITSQFSDCLLISIIHNRNMENRIIRIHEKALNLVYDNCWNLSFKELLAKDNSVSTHKKIFKLSLQKSLKQNKGFHQKEFQIYIIFKRNHTMSENNNMLQRKKDSCFFWHIKYFIFST